MATTVIVDLLCVLGIALSVKSMLVLGVRAPWTSAGWALTVVYLVDVLVTQTLGARVPRFIEYVVLGALAVAFVLAGLRDERQAEPWWWPTTQGATRAEKRSDAA